MGNYVGPQFEAVIGSKPHKLRLAIIALVVISAIAFGGFKFTEHQKAAHRAKAAGAVERWRLVKAVDQAAYAPPRSIFNIVLG